VPGQTAAQGWLTGIIDAVDLKDSFCEVETIVVTVDMKVAPFGCPDAPTLRQAAVWGWSMPSSGPCKATNIAPLSDNPTFNLPAIAA
jgi:hypothetical protein